VLVPGLDALEVHRRAELHRAPEGAVAPLGVVARALLRLALLALLARERQHVAGHADVEVLRIDAGHLSAHADLLGGLGQLERDAPVATALAGLPAGAPHVVEHVVEQAVPVRAHPADAPAAVALPGGERVHGVPPR
jgi:hypothetical protein